MSSKDNSPDRSCGRVENVLTPPLPLRGFEPLRRSLTPPPTELFFVLKPRREKRIWSSQKSVEALTNSSPTPFPHLGGRFLKDSSPSFFSQPDEPLGFRRVFSSQWRSGLLFSRFSWIYGFPRHSRNARLHLMARSRPFASAFSRNGPCFLWTGEPFLLFLPLKYPSRSKRRFLALLSFSKRFAFFASTTHRRRRSCSFL